MAIILKNPMPMNGALFVTNPRKRRKSSKKSLSSLVKRHAEEKEIFTQAQAQKECGTTSYCCKVHRLWRTTLRKHRRLVG